MRLIAAFLKLVRLPNLFFIALTQALFQFCIYQPMYKGVVPSNDLLHFIFLSLASVLIAAAGYIINDYFDINIDEVNKPGRMVVDKVIHRRWAIAWHFMLNSAALILTILALPFLEKWYLILANMFSMALLWFYSTSFKKKLLIGNIVISILTAWTILLIFFSKVNLEDAIGGGSVDHHKFFRFAFLYAGFAFVITIIREAIKDMEDMPGDAKYGCRTMPIKWGINATKVYTAVWLVVLIALIIVLLVYILIFKWWLLIAWGVFAILIPLIIVLLKLKAAVTQSQYHQLSNMVKFVIFTGISSMIFFYFYL